MDKFSATAVATIAATALSFAASRYWTFRHRERSGAGRETALFFAVNGIGMAITEGCVELAAALGLTGTFSYNIALNGGIGLAAVFRYWSYRRWIWPSAATASGRVSRPTPAAAGLRAADPASGSRACEVRRCRRARVPRRARCLVPAARPRGRRAADICRRRDRSGQRHLVRG